MDSSGANIETRTIQNCIRELMELPVIKQFAVVWDDMGLEEKHRAARRATMKEHLQRLLEEMVQEEQELKRKLAESVQSCTKELQQLCSDLSLSCPQISEQLTLLERERQLRSQVDSMTKEKHSRLKRYKRLAEMEDAICDSLGEETKMVPEQQFKKFPSEEDLAQFRKRIEELEEKKEIHQAEFFSVREKIIHVWEELEIVPEKPFELIVSDGDIKNFILSDSNMKMLVGLFQELEGKAVKFQGESLYLREKIASLWNRLQIPEAARDNFNNLYSGFTSKIIKALKNELERLDQLKKQNLQRFVLATQAELHTVWDKCMFGEQQRREFSPAYTENFDDDSLSAHESELDRMKGFYSDNEEIFKLIEKREKLWIKYLEFEKSDNNPDKYHNRGGQLLKEQKLKKQVQKDLPKVENELKTVLTQWEQDHERYLIVHDERYLDTIDRQWGEKKQLEEQEKLEKQKAKVESTMMELVYGSKPSTPLKRRAAGTPPSSAPSSKVRKVGPSPLVNITASSTTSHGSVASRRAAQGPGKTPSRQQRPVGAGRNILKEKNVMPTFALVPNESIISHGNTSLASTVSYTDFQNGLKLGLDCQKVQSNTLPRSSSVLRVDII